MPVDTPKKMKPAKTDAQARTILERLIRTLNHARTIHFEGRKLHPNWAAGRVDGHVNDKPPVTRQKYYLQNDGGINRIRVESSATVFGMTVATLFIKNEEGIWEVLTDQVGEVSKIFTSDQLLGVFPFRRLFSCLQHPYDLQWSEEQRGDAGYFVVTGKLPDAPGASGQDIAKEFAYKIGLADGLLYSLHELTLRLRSNDIELDKMELNRPFDPALFELPDKPKIMLSSLEQWTESRNQEMTKRLRSS
jgi:hypothetical protein